MKRLKVVEAGVFISVPNGGVGLSEPLPVGTVITIASDAITEDLLGTASFVDADASGVE